MKIGYFADGPWSHLALDKILRDDSLEVCFIVPRFDTQDPILREVAIENNIDFLPIKNVNQPDSIKSLSDYSADIYVSMSFNQILKKDILFSCEYGFINCHAGALPFYRGRNILNWALINDEKEFGVTVHHVDEGIDTGDIILQRMVPITDKDDYSTLLEKATKVCADTLYKSLVNLSEGKADRIPQKTIHPVGFYCCRRKQGDEIIDWNWNSRRIFNFVRAITYPGPCARSIHNGKEFKVVRSELIESAPDYIANPGEVTALGSDSLIVKTGDSTIRIFVESLENKEFFLKYFKIGDRLGKSYD